MIPIRTYAEPCLANKYFDSDSVSEFIRFAFDSSGSASHLLRSVEPG